MDTKTVPSAGPDKPAFELPEGTVLVAAGRLAHLENINREYGVTVTTLGIVLEKLLALTGQETLYLPASERMNPPDFRAGVMPDDITTLWMKTTREERDDQQPAGA